jgi:hypothetical protein
MDLGSSNTGIVVSKPTRGTDVSMFEQNLEGYHSYFVAPISMTEFVETTNA